MNKKELNFETHNQFLNDRSFKDSIGLIKQIERSVLFENGFHWNMDEDIAEFPKITLNVIKQIGMVLKANIMQNEYGYLVNSNNFKSIRKIQDFLKYQAEMVNMKVKDLKAIGDDFVKGTAIGYFYYDKEKHGFLSNRMGNMAYDIIDIRRYAVANPYNQDTQSQEWIIVAIEEKIGALKARYGEDKNIVPDGARYTAETENRKATTDINEELVNVYIKFYRNEEGQVIWHVCTETCMLSEPRAYNPYYMGKDFMETPSTTKIPDALKGKRKKMSKKIWNLYPFAKLCLNERDNCYYGVPIAYEYIEAQKSINNHHSVYDKALQDNVIGGYVYREGSIDPEDITTENGQLIKAKTMANEPLTNVLQRLPVANVPADSFNYSQNLINTTRQVSGSSNVQLGMSDYANQSGKQTQMLLERAKENASAKSMLFNEFKKQQAYIMFLFAKFYYSNENFQIIEHGVFEDTVREYHGEESFKGEEYIDDNVMIDIRVGTAPSFSEYSNVEMLGLMVQSGQAPFESYVYGLPEGYISNKQEVLNIAKENSLKKIQELQSVIEQQKRVMEQMVESYKQTTKDRENIDVLIKENQNLKSMLAEVTANAVRQSTETTKQNQQIMQDMQNLLTIVQNQQK